MTAVGDSAENATEIYDRFTAVLDTAAANGHTSPRAPGGGLRAVYDRVADSDVRRGTLARYDRATRRERGNHRTGCIAQGATATPDAEPDS